MTTPEDQPLAFVVHIDIQPQFHDEGQKRLIDFVTETATDDDVEIFELLREHKLDNHYMLVGRFPDQAAYDRFVQSSYVIAMRDDVASWLGSPWDERPATRIDRHPR